MTEKKNEAQKQQMVKVRYEKTSAEYAAQFVLNMSEEEIIINFSSGMMPDPNGENHLPIHSRIAMTPNNARKLAALLNQALGQYQKNQQPAVAPSIASEVSEAKKKS
jgi:hypothetical protein